MSDVGFRVQGLGDQGFGVEDAHFMWSIQSLKEP